MKLDKYLHRIGYTPSASADIKTLRGLQAAHMLTVPFENLDIGFRPILLDENSLWSKLITHKRGGFCYELNGLFAWLLKEIGFEVTYFNARVYSQKDNTFGMDFDHLTLMVRIPHESTRWLVDVGFGDSFTQPLNIDDTNEQVQGLRGYWVEAFRDGYQLWQRNYDGSRERQYFFDLIPRRFPDEYLDACLYHQTSPESMFTRKRIITRLTEDGRVSLDNEKLIITSNGERTTQEVKEAERTSLLKKYFDVTL
ncbi:MAG: arylamine N-acetyltransferase [Anaerolineales bacterium]|nr:arylamine N-acetyltransferase [Anaerolineales bacterium]